MITRPRAAIGFLLLSALPLTACANEAPKAADGSEKVKVVASFYPIQHIVEQVSGEHVDVTNLTRPGAEPHDLELTPQDAATVSKARLVVFEKGLQPAVDDAVKAEAADHNLDLAEKVDLSLKHEEAIGAEAGHDEHGDEDAHAGETKDPHAGETKDAHADEDAAEPTAGDGHAGETKDPHAGETEGAHEGEGGHEGHEHEMEAGTTDPHFWLDPQRYGKAAEAVAAKLKEIDPAHAAQYDANLKTFTGKLDALDTKMAAGLKTCKSKDLVTAHAAFGYLANRYGFKQVAIAGLSAEAEPEPGQLTAVADFVKKNKVSTIYTETILDPKHAETIAKETGAQTAVLDPIEGINDKSAAKDYLGIMEANLAALQKGQQCS